MILSEFAGAAQSLNGSLVVNPWDSQQVADAIHEAVTMPEELRAENHWKLFKYVTKYSAAFWGTSFVKEMLRITPSSEGSNKAGPAALQVSSADGASLSGSTPVVVINRSEQAASG